MKNQTDKIIYFVVGILLIIALAIIFLFPEKKNEQVLEKITFTESNITLNIGEDYKLKYTVMPVNTVITFTSSNKKVATVDENGYIKAISKGSSTITATTPSGNKANCLITVKEKNKSESKTTVINPTKITLSKTSIELKVGESTTLTATISPTNATDKRYIWDIEDETIASVKDGKITAKKAGKTTITVTTANDKTAKCTLTVKSTTPATPTKVVTSKIHIINGYGDSILIESDGHYGLVDTSNPYNDGTKQDAQHQPITYNETVEHVKNYLKSLGVKYLDFVIATHSHSDHIGGVPVIAANFVNKNTKYYYRTYVTTKEETTQPSWDNAGYYQRAVNAMKNKGATLIEVTNKNPTITIGDFKIKLLNTEPASGSELSGGLATGENKNAFVEYVTYKDKYKILLAADMEFEDEMKVANQIGKIDILKMGHHSWKTSTGMNFINVLQPKIAIVTYRTFVNSYALKYYMENSFKTNFYGIGDSSKEIVIDFNDTKYTITPDSRKIAKSAVTRKTGNWLYIDNAVWMYYENNKPLYSTWRTIDNIEYHFNIFGEMSTGWVQTTKSGVYGWYYLNSDGSILKDTCKTIENKYYCFNKNGKCYSGNGC